MGKYTEQMKDAIKRRVAQRIPLADAYHRLKSKLFKAENIWQKQIDELRETAKREKRRSTPYETAQIGNWVSAKAIERQKRAEADRLEASGWAPTVE